MLLAGASPVGRRHRIPRRRSPPPPQRPPGPPLPPPATARVSAAPCSAVSPAGPRFPRRGSPLPSPHLAIPPACAARPAAGVPRASPRDLAAPPSPTSRRPALRGPASIPAPSPDPGPAAQWWDSHGRSLPAGTTISWPNFQAAFCARFIPKGIMDRKKCEFRKLTQGNNKVDSYQCDFLDLSHCAEEDISTDARRQEKFRDGLQADIKLALLVHDFADFATLVKKAIQVETSLQEHQGSLGRNRDTGSSSVPPSQKRRIWIPNSMYYPTAPTPGPSYVAPRLPPPPPRHPRLPAAPPRAPNPRPNDGLCSKCGLPVHCARECPQNQY
nr:max-binding protein MNT-like [Aegilops tauschii subsp. strangulata]